MTILQDRGQAAQAGNERAYNDAHAKLRPNLRAVKKFTPEGRTVMSQFEQQDLRRAVVADGDAWQEWAVTLLQPGEISLEEGRRIADMATEAFVKHERAYEAAGREPPIEFQRRPDQQ